ncbi:MAG: 4Fe-4S binding protein [Bacillota bacterium]
MANLKTVFAGVEFNNPVWLGSATPSWDGERMRLAGVAGAGAIVPKTIGPKQDWAKHPRNGRFAVIRAGNRPIGQVNLELFTTKTREDWINEDLQIAKQGGAKIVASVLAMPDPIDTGELVKEIQNTGLVDMLELNVSCPMPASTVGMHIGKNPSLVFKQASAAKKAAEIPLSVKMTPNVSDMVEIAKAAKDGGADALTISNSIRSFAGVDIETGRPRLRGYGGYTGPAIKPIIQRHLSEVAREVDIPICAIGGISSWKEAVEYIMLGASAVQVVTAVMWKGYEVLTSIIEGLSSFMDEKGYKSIEDFKGIALPYITTIEELAELPPKFAFIDQDKCTNCEVCSTVCFYGAISKNGSSTTVITRNCDGCGACEQWCPKNAIELRELS